MHQLYTDLKNFGVVKTNTELSKFTTFKIGGKAQFLVNVSDNAKLIELLNYCSQNGVAYFIIGGGSNLLLSDSDFEGVVIRVLTNKIYLENNTIIAEAGAQLSAVMNLAAKNSLGGLEWAVGIPGTIGGAVRGNAGAMGQDTSNSISKIEIWRDGEIMELSKEECGFGYRESAIKNGRDVILRAWFTLAPTDKKEIMEKTTAYMKQRAGRFPKFPSAGSFFKNVNISEWKQDINDLPPIYIERKKIPVGWIIDQCELKGLTVGGAKVSDEHGNFIVNFQNATQDDVLKVVALVKEKVYNKFEIELQPEVEIT